MVLRLCDECFGFMPTMIRRPAGAPAGSAANEELLTLFCPGFSQNLIKHNFCFA